MPLLLTSYNLNINIIEQRLVQLFGYVIGDKFLHELMFLGMNYSFKFANTLNLENIKGNFYMSGLLQYKNLINQRSPFKCIVKSAYIILKQAPFIVFKKFYTLMNKINPILNILDFLINIGARANKIQQSQIVGMRGILNTSSGYNIKFPLIQNFERGLNLIEYIMSAYGIRKGLLDTSIRTSESGYLTRRLVEIIQDVILKEHYCGSKMFLIMRKFHDIIGNLCLPNYQILFTKYFYKNINNCTFYIKSPILCQSGRSVCVNCMGFSFKFKILIGESIGVSSGELLGEPTTQATLRTFHTGGVSSFSKINTFYKFKKNLNNLLPSNKFKIIANMRMKKIVNINIFDLINNFKCIKYSTYLKFNNKLKFNFKKLSFYTTNSIITQFTIFYINYPFYKSFVRYKFKLMNTYLLDKFINLYSSYIIIKTNINKWDVLLLSNSMSYSNLYYFNKNFGGVYYNKFNLIKFYFLMNKIHV